MAAVPTEPPPLVDRQEEVARIAEALDAAERGKGQLLLLRGEAGCGKTRLVQEAVAQAARRGFVTGFGTSLSESVVPYHPWKEVLEGLRLGHILEESPPPKLLGLYVVTAEGEIAAREERENATLPPSAVSAISTDACGHATPHGDLAKDGAFTLLPLDRVRGVALRADGFHLGAILDGREDEALLSDLRDLARELELSSSASVQGKGGNDARAFVRTALRELLEAGKHEGVDYTHSDPKLRQARLFDHVALGLSRRAEVTPQLVAVDDLQWADPSSLALLQYVARNVGESRVLLIGAYRVEEAGVRPHLKDALAKMERDRQPPGLLVSGLPREEMRRLAEVFLGPHVLPGDFLDLLWRETQGYPLFIREVLRGLEADGAIQVRDRAKRLERPAEQLAIPTRVREAIRLRLEKLPKDERRVLDAAAACGTRFTTALLARVAGEEESRVLPNLNNLVRVHGLLRATENGFSFDHPAVQEVAYEVIPEDVRRAYHIEAAEWLELVGGPCEDAAEHYYRARDPRAGQKLREAAESARARYANAEAIRFYRESLELVKGEDERAWILEGLGDACELVGDYDRSIEAHRKLLALLAEGGPAARVRMKLARALEKKGAHPESIAVLEEALAGLGDGDPGDVAMVLAQLGHVYLLRGEYDTALRHLDRSLELSRRLNDRKGVATALCAIGEIRWVRTELDMALAPLMESLEIREEDGPLKELCETRDIIAFVHLDRGDCRQALEHMSMSLAVAERIGDMWRTASSYNTIGLAHLMMGECDLALEFLARSLRMGERFGHTWGIAFNWNFIGLAHLKNGNHDQALAALKRSLKIREGLGDRWGLTWTYCALAEAYCAQGAWDRARECGKQTLDLARQLGLRQKEAAAHRVLGMVSRGQGQWSDAIENFDESLRIFRAIGMMREEAESHYEFGLMWAKKGELGHAREEMASATELFQRLNLQNGVDRAARAQEGWAPSAPEA